MFNKKMLFTGIPIIGFLALGFLALGFFPAGICYAHTPLCSCYDNADGTITCEGGFSDGSSASGVEMRVEDKSGKILIKGKMDEDSEYTFDKPAKDYKVIFDAGEGHEIEVDGKEITE
ncbi:MAG: hypothetical protein K8S13_01495 [Desulfobacula sp.]|uniref:hypothetical protein n=1 Tax=Desulfobacula sp. TaxID=2593537 RepID=UPI0025BFD43E|nr:hypothetical protein [Desulfobacula sp.]MCD4718522.1 hypothetical protein [Desulfobacula sp.]